MSRGVPPFKLRLLGSPRIEGPAGPVDLPLGKPLAALCYLALEPSVRRSDVARLLWPSSSPARAKASVRQAIWLLRKQTDGELLVDQDGELHLNRSLVCVDLDEFDANLGEGRLEDALASWEGGPLRGLSVPDAPPWTTWADEIRSRWETRFGNALEERASTCDPEARADWLSAAVDVRPYRVSAWVDLIHHWVDVRDSKRAEESLARLRSVADADDRAILDDTEERIRLLRRSAYGDPTERLSLDFVGRSEEFSALMAGWRAAVAGHPGLWALMGTAGIGKTALANEVTRHIRLDGGTLVEAQAFLAEQELELGVVATLVRDLFRRPGAAGISPGSAEVLKSLVPSEGEASMPHRPPTALADALADLIGAVSHEAPLLLIVDDAHWMDHRSAIVLLRAIRLLDHAEVMMVWTCRSSEGEASSAAVEAIEAARRQELVRGLDLAPLGLAEVRELITLLLAEHDPEQLEPLVTRVHVVSGGSPLHIVEILRGLRDRGLLGLDAQARWVLAEDAVGVVVDPSPSLGGVFTRRLEELTPNARHVALALAREGGARTPLFLQSYQYSQPTLVDEGLTELIQRGVVRWTRDDRLDFSHGTLAKALLEIEQARLSPAAAGAEPIPAPPRRWFRWAVPALAIAVAATVAAVVLRTPPTTPPPPFGGGTIWLKSDVAAQPVRYVGGDEPWAFGDSILIPEGVSIQEIHEAVDGSVTLTGLTNGDPLRTPAAVGWRDGRLDTVFASSGDDSLVDLSPSGRGLLLHTQHADTARYRQTVVVMDDETSRLHVVASGPQSYLSASWSPDGQRVLLRVNAAWDSVRVSDPAGRFAVARAAPYPEIRHPRFCGSNAALFESPPPGRMVAQHIWRFDEADVRELQLSREATTTPVCSPDGSVVAYVTETDESRSLVLETLDGAVISESPLPGELPIHLHWTAPSLSPSQIRIDPMPTRLARGERLDATATVLDQTGKPFARDVAWSSDNPSVVSVRPSGRVTANRAGQTTIRAVVDGWIADSVEVEVTVEADSERIAVSDSFAVLDTTKWIRLGDPDPEPIRNTEGDPALYLNGDGLFTDGIASWEEYDLSEGGTLEASFWMGPFQRDDRNRIMVCLVDGDPGADPTNHGDWVERQEACALWPPGEGVDFDPESLLLSAGNRAIGAVPTDTLLTTERWQRLAVQIRPDGEVSALVNDSLIVTHPLPLRNDSTVRWHVRVTGHSVENTLLMRDLTLWEELRVPERPGGNPQPQP